MPPIDKAAPHVTKCDTCGQSDNHPKAVFFTGEKFHFDCLTPENKAEVLAPNLTDAERARVAAVIAHAEGDDAEHLHGDDLRAKHVELMEAEQANG